MPRNPYAGGGEDYFADTSSAVPPKSTKSEEPGSDSTALVPQSLCPGMEPGDEFVVRVERVHDSQYEVSYSKSPEETEEPEPEEMTEETPAQAGPPSGLEMEV